MNHRSSISNPQSCRRGFTLVEMIVSLAIFTIVAVVALTALIKIIDANNKAQTIQSAVTSLSFSLDAMSREIRSGSNIQCVKESHGDFDPTTANLAITSCSIGAGDTLIAFQSSRSNTSGSCALWYAYYFTGGTSPQFEKAEQPVTTTDCSDRFYSTSFTSIIPQNITLSSSQSQMGVIYDQNTHPYPLVFVELSGTAGTKAVTQTDFTVQTAASPRTP